MTEETEAKVEKASVAPYISVCNIMSESTTQIIQKLESLLPNDMQLFSDLYRKYLHSIEDMFQVCYISEKEIMGRMPLDPRFVEQFDSLSRSAALLTISQIEMANNIQKTYMESSISSMRIFDEYVHLMLDAYAKILSRSFNFPVQKT